MQKRKLQVFVSSTYLDLKEERQTAVQAILSAGHIPAGMELFTAGDESQWNIIKEWIDESDVYMLILGARYGSVEPKSGKSYTQLEYEYALEKGKAHFALVLNEIFIDKKVAKQTRQVVLEQNNEAKLRDFKSLVTPNKMCAFCDDEKDIKLQTILSLNTFEKRPNLTGWVRATDTDYSEIAEQLARLSKENEELRAKQSHSVIVNGIEVEKLKQIMINQTFFEILETDDPFKDNYIAIDFPKGFDNMFTFFCEYYFNFENLSKLSFYNETREFFNNGVSYLRSINLLSRETAIYKSNLTEEAVKLYMWHLSTIEA